jgi:hypothetical protein
MATTTITITDTEIALSAPTLYECGAPITPTTDLLPGLTLSAVHKQLDCHEVSAAESGNMT